MNCASSNAAPAVARPSPSDRGQDDELELDEIEIQRADGQPIIDLPEMENVTVMRSSRWT